MYPLDIIEVNQLRDVHEVLAMISNMFDCGGEVHAGALLFEDDETIEEHVNEAVTTIAAIVNRARAHGGAV